MISEGVNTVILVLFGILLGVSFLVYSYLGHLAVRERKASSKPDALHMPRSYWVSLSVFFAIVGLLSLTIHFTPVYMGWVPLLVPIPGVFIAFGFATKTGPFGPMGLFGRRVTGRKGGAAR